MTAAEQQQEPTEGLWVRCDVMPTGEYAAVITLDADHVWHLDRAAALEHAAVCIEAATAVEHDAAVITLMLDRVRVTLPQAGAIITAVRERRPQRYDVLSGLALAPGVAVDRDRGRIVPRPFIAMATLPDGKQFGQITTEQLRSHAAATLTVAAVVDLDAALYRVLCGQVGLDDDGARRIIEELSDYWPGGAP